MHGMSSRQLELMPAAEYRDIWHSLNESQQRELLDLLATLLLHGLPPATPETCAAAEGDAADATASTTPFNAGEPT